MIRKHFPNFITCLNLLSGCVAVVYGIEGSYLLAAIFVGAAAVFDFLDGLAARMLKAYSPLGKELDSLADLVSFGVAPGAVVYRYLETQSFLYNTPEWIAWAGFLLPVFSALRLAKFNLDDRQTNSFLGLPTPANALFWVYGLGTTIGISADFNINTYLILAGIVVFSGLMVSSIPMFSLKFKNASWKDNQMRYLFLAGCAILLVIFSYKAISLCVFWFILLSVMKVLVVKKSEN